MDIPTIVVVIWAATGSAVATVIFWVVCSIVAERRAERRYGADPDAFFEKERQDTDKYDIPALLAKMKENKRGGGLSGKKSTDSHNR